MPMNELIKAIFKKHRLDPEGGGILVGLECLEGCRWRLFVKEGGRLVTHGDASLDPDGALARAAHTYGVPWDY